jgi:uncharacterized protein (DUF488 family)
MNPLATIGYQGAPQDAVLDALAGAGVDLLVDVRAVAASRRPGFSKRQLAAGLDARGIAYVHLRALGTPKEGRLAARGGRLDELARIYAAHFAGAPAQAEYGELLGLLRAGRRVCLLCFEHDPGHCHRRFIAEAATADLGVAVHDLLP